MVLGNYSDVLLLLARERHAEGRQLLATGVDPMAKRKQSKIEKKVSGNDRPSLPLRSAHGYAERNRAADICPSDVLQKVFETNYARIDAKELPQLLRHIQVYPGRHVTRLALRLLALIFVRMGELIGAEWSELDFENARWNIPAERMKMRSFHLVPLSIRIPR